MVTRIRCTIFPTGAIHPQQFYAQPVYQTALGNHAEDLDFSSLFPNGSYSFTLSSIPGTNQLLPHEFRVFVSATLAPSVLNISIEQTFGQIWMGNIVVVKCGYHTRQNAIQMTPEDGQLVKFIIQMCVGGHFFSSALNILTDRNLCRWLEEYYTYDSDYHRV